VESKKAVLESKNLDIVDATILLPILQRSFDDKDERNARRRRKIKKVGGDGDKGDKEGDGHDIDDVGDNDGVGDGYDSDDATDTIDAAEVAGEETVSVEVEKPWLHFTACYDATNLASDSKLATYVAKKKLNLYIVKETVQAGKFEVKCPFGEWETPSGICIVLALKIDALRAKPAK
jgi:hypothetical protein